MQNSMVALAAFCRRRRRLVLLLWAIVLLVAAPLAARQSTHLTGGGFSNPNSQSGEVQRDLSEFPGAAGAPLAVVLVPSASDGPLQMSRAVRKTRREIAAIDGTRLDPPSPRAGARRPVIVGLTVTSGSDGDATDVANQLRDAFGITSSHPGRLGQVRVYVSGQGALWAALQANTEQDVKTAELRAFPAIAIVLLVVFGSLAAALLPLALGAAAVTGSGALIYLLSLSMETSVFVTSVSSMLGLGVAVDYSLFVLVRYREEIRAGAGAERALGLALSTSGVAVIFSGLTVMASLAGLFFIDSTALRSIAAGAIVVVAVSVLAASTLLPTLIALLGDRVHEPGKLAGAMARRWRGGEGRDGFWTRWSGAVMRRPVVSVLAAAAALLALGAPVIEMRIENAGLRQIDRDDPFRTGTATIASVAGKGALGPVQIVVANASEELAPLPRGALAAVRRATARDPLVDRVAPPRLSRDDSRALLVTTLRADPTAERSRSAVRRLRERLPAVAGPGTTVSVGGTTATIVDFDSLVSSSLWKIALFVCGLSFLVLVPLLRSIVLPLKAVLMTMLSVVAAYGVVVAIFQWGWLGFLGLSQAPYVDTITPALILVIAFGLSMDYEVFMLSRIRERYLASGDTRTGVAQGLASTGRTITSAALIMVLVFLAFVSSGLPTVQRLGIGLAVAVALDATLVRLVLLPAAMALLDEWNWWLPRPLERLLGGGQPGRPGEGEKGIAPERVSQ